MNKDSNFVERVIGLDSHPDSFTAALIRGHTPAIRGLKVLPEILLNPVNLVQNPLFPNLCALGVSVVNVFY